MNAVSAEAQIAFLNNLQRLLAEGQFTATYKFALILALADICVEKGQDDEAAFVVPTSKVAEKFIHYYWRQIRPFAGGQSEPFLLRQNTSQPPAVIRELQELSVRGIHSITELRQSAKAWSGLVGKVRKIICAMPLGKLQTVGNSSMAFLYDDSSAKSGRIVESVELKPGVMFCLRKFHALITDLVRGAWVRYVRRYNADRLGAPMDLDEFLFGSERAPLQIYVPILREIQDSRCFYCEREMTLDKVHVDHFIPWSRYPIDLAHNFVLSHASCNSAKADHLAAVIHMENWIARNNMAADYLEGEFDQARLLHDKDVSYRIAQWAYLQAGENTPTWEQGSRFQPLSSTWIKLFAA